MFNKAYLGIDPGQAGGIAMVFHHSGYTKTQAMPSTEESVWAFLQRYGVTQQEESFSTEIYMVTAMIEQVHSMPGQGVSSTFKFGVGYGGLRMALVAAGITFYTVTPQQWQRHYGMKRSKGEPQPHYKKRLLAKAQELFPSEKVTLKTADALLIALYCKLKYGVKR